MGELAIAVRAAALLTLLLIAGFAAARVAGRRPDLFAIVWWGLALVSLAGTLLARTGRFSLSALGVTVATVALGAAAIARVRRGAPVAAVVATDVNGSGVRLVACAAGLAAVLWAWPPYETFIAAADSTMYVNAGVHLARTGSYEVPGTIAPLLSPALAKALFVSVGYFDQGPYIRLPGGLLMTRRDAGTATPAFFPLVSTWTGIFAAVGGPGLAPVVAPLGMGLAAWALTLFAGEAFGVATAVVTALVFLGNFAVWWFGRFTMSEPLTIAFVWGAFVLVGRHAPFAAGVMFALAGLARSETLVFAVAALGWWALWTPVRPRDLGLLASGLVVAGLVAALGFVGAPNHHLAYLWNDVLRVWANWTFTWLPAILDGRIATAAALAPMLPILVAIVLSWVGGDAARTVGRWLLTAAIVLGTILYARVFGGLDTVRHVRWLATSMSPLGLLVATAGLGLLWSRGGPAGRLALVLTVIVAAVFLPSPRVAAYQPWAMRRYLPVVLPGLALGAGALIGLCLQSRRYVLRGVGVLLTMVILAVQLPPTIAGRRAGYFADSLEGVSRLAAQMPADALVVVDGGFADMQLQVPLWLTFGRESITASGGGSAWRELLATLVATGRPVYWVQNRFAAPPESAGFSFAPVGSDVDFSVSLPDSPVDTPPAAVMRKLVPLGLYGVKSTA